MCDCIDSFQRTGKAGGYRMEAEGRQPAESKPLPESGCSGTGGVPIAALLIVEDDKKTNEAICEYLKSAGHETIPAYDGAEAIQIFREEK